jgi:histidinol-phosphatase (PHP family)
MTVRGLVDYHLHTATSSDAQATVSEYCIRAAKLGLAEIAITNHMNLRTEKYHLTPAVFAEVWAEIGRCHDRFPDLVVRIGLEVDYFEDLKAEIAEALPTYAEAIGRPLDFIMGSAHEMHGVRFASRKQAHELLAGTDPVPIYREFFGLMTEVAESGLFDIVAHPDLIRRFTGLHNPPVEFGAYREAAETFVTALVANGVGIEVNVKGLDHPVGAVYPSEEFLRCYLDTCGAAGVEPIITLGTDAHRQEGLGTNLDVGAEVLRRMGITEIATFEGGVRGAFRLPDPSQERRGENG